MRLLLDTHTLLWWDGTSSLLSDAARNALKDGSNTVFMSVVNAWEMQIKTQLRKLTLHKPLADIINEQRINNGFELLDVELSHVLALDSLPFHHKDPFDRLLIAQARHENLTLVSNDGRFSPYSVKLLW